MKMRSTVLSAFICISLVGFTACSERVRPLGQTQTQKQPDQADYTKTALIPYEYQTGEIKALCEKAIQTAQSQIAQIKALDPSERTLENTLLVFEKALADFSDQSGPLTFMGYVSTQESLRDESASCEEKVGAFYPTLLADKALYEALKSGSPKTPEETRLKQQTLLSFEKNGMNLDEEKLAQVKELKQKLSKLQTDFSANLNNDVTTVKFSKEALAGVSDSFLARLKKDEAGNYIVTTKSTYYVSVMENASNAETRKAMALAYNNRASDKNPKLLEDAILLRQQIAKLLGYKTWADYQIDGRMAKSSESVLAFLTGLKDKLSIRKDQDMAKLLEFKKTYDPSATTVNLWDVSYLANQVKKKEFSVDDELISEYFPAETVVKGLFEVYSTLLGVSLKEVVGAKVWAEGVKLYEIRDQASGELMAYFFADLIPREGKYGHAAAFPLISGRVLDTGKYSYPVASIVANFTPPSDGKPSLLTHDEVETFFHEFGHIMHQTLTKAPFASLSGTAVAQDFVEAPSQMLEGWAWDSKILDMISGHYLDPSKKLPLEMREKMIAAKNFNLGYFTMRQLLFGLFDMKIHSTEGAVDVTQTYDALFAELMGIPNVEGSHFAGTFGHLMGGYDAGYYGYLWSEVYAADMFSQFEEKGLLNSELGMSYRKNILSSGNMKEAIDLLKDFLGREPSADAFYKKLGISN